MEVRHNIIRIARTWIGTPYHPHARTRNVGVDCLQFILEVYKEAGIASNLPEYEYNHTWHLHRSEEKYIEGIKAQVPQTEDPDTGDLVMFRFGRCVSHAGILMPDKNSIIHSYVRVGVIITELDEHIIRGRVDSYWKVV